MLRRLSYSVLLVAMAAAGYLGGLWHAPRQTVAAAGAESPRAVLYYQCPMHPAFKADRPGTAPCCGMALRPVYADSAPTAGPSHLQLPQGAIAVPAEQQQLMGVKVGTVDKASGTERVRLFGRVAPDETRIRKLNVGLDGYIREMSEVTTGSFVRKDQLLASFSTPEARQPISAYIVTLDVLEREQRSGGGNPAQLGAATASMQVAVDRLLTLGMSPVQLEEIERTRVVPTHINVTSPVAGFVVARNVSTGEKFERGAELFQIADLARVWILADVPSADADQIRPGMEARVIVRGRSAPVRARVSSKVLPRFDPATQSFKLRLEADNPGFALRPDMFVDVDVQVPYQPTVLVPADAVVVSGLSTHVFVETGAGVFEPRDVEIGRRVGDRIMVAAGLNPGDRIALSATFLLDSESRMKAHDQPSH